jgi:hypothetical protein
MVVGMAEVGTVVVVVGTAEVGMVEVGTEVEVTEDGMDPLATLVPIRVPGVDGVVAVIVEIIGVGTAGAIPGRGTDP